MERVIDRFDQYMAANGLTDYKVSMALKLSNGTIGKSRQEGRDLSGKVVRQILSYYTDIREEWLLFGKGSMLKSQQPAQTETIEKLQMITIPLIPLRAAAGYLSGFDNDGVRIEDCEQYTIPTFYRKGADFLIEVAGDSMMPKFQNGDIVACRKVTDISFIQWGYTYVIDTTGGVIMKELNRCQEDDSQFICHSLNPQYADFELPRKSVRSLAMVVGIISSLA